MSFHGTEDIIAPYEGGSQSTLHVEESFSYWADANGCTADPVATVQMSEVECMTYAACYAGTEVTNCRIVGGGHCWPGNDFFPLRVLDPADRCVRGDARAVPERTTDRWLRARVFTPLPRPRCETIVTWQDPHLGICSRSRRCCRAVAPS